MMLLKKDFARKYPAVAEGTVVRCRDGEKLGKISVMDDDSFVVQKGLFFPKDFIFRYEDIRDYRDGEITVNVHHTELDEWRDESYSGWSHVDNINDGRLSAEPRPEFRDRYADWKEDLDTTRDQVRIPVVEEELEAQKTIRQAGQVRLRKVVHTELRHFTVPVTTEQVTVERVPVSEGTPAADVADAFQEKTIAIPIMEEDVTVTKRPVVKEEVRVHKTREEEQRDVSDEVRKEEVQVDEDVPRKNRKR